MAFHCDTKGFIRVVWEYFPIKNFGTHRTVNGFAINTIFYYIISFSTDKQ